LPWIEPGTLKALCQHAEKQGRPALSNGGIYRLTPFSRRMLIERYWLTPHELGRKKVAATDV
jgi:hypothetical protein